MKKYDTYVYCSKTLYNIYVPNTGRHILNLSLFATAFTYVCLCVGKKWRIAMRNKLFPVPTEMSDYSVTNRTLAFEY
jgi:hypothetical protein